MQAKKNHTLLLSILLIKAPCIYSEQSNEQEAHNHEIELLSETIDERGKGRKIDHPIRTKKGLDTKID